METENQYVTKKDFYSVAVSLSLLIMFTNTLGKTEGFGNLYVAIWATVLVLYYTSKLHMARKNHKVTHEVQS